MRIDVNTSPHVEQRRDWSGRRCGKKGKNGPIVNTSTLWTGSVREPDKNTEDCRMGEAKPRDCGANIKRRECLKK